MEGNNRPYSGSEKASSETDTLAEASLFTITPIGIESNKRKSKQPSDVEINPCGEQSESEKIFDPLRNNLKRSHSLPREGSQDQMLEVPGIIQQEESHSLHKTTDKNKTAYDLIEKRIHQYIDEYQENIILHVSNLTEMQDYLEASRDQLAQWQAQTSEYETILEESKQVVGEKIGDTVTPLLDELRRVEQEVIDLKEKQDEIIPDSPEKDEHHSWYKEKLQDLAIVQSWLEYQIYCSELITPADKVYIQYEKHRLARQDWEAIHEEVLARSKACLTPSVQEDGTQSLPEAAEIIQLLRKVKPIQRRVNLCSWWRSPESREKVERLVETIQQLHEHAIATKNHLYEYGHSFETYAQELDQKLDRSLNLLKDLERQVWPDHYNPYYSMDRVISKEDVEIDSTLPGPCGIRATRRGLSILGVDICSDATEKKIVPLVEYPSINDKKGGVRPKKISEAYQAYGFDYRYYEGSLTVEEIKHIVEQGHVVNVGVYKPEIGGHFLLIEGVTKRENGYHVTFYDPHDSKRVTLPYEELEKVLAGHYTLSSEEQMKTREPILLGEQIETREPIVSEEQIETREPIRKTRVKAKTKMLWRVLACFGAGLTGRGQRQNQEA